MKRFSFVVLAAAIAVQVQGGAVKGKIDGVAAANDATVVVWIDEAVGKPASPAVVSQKGLQFTPSVLPVVAGQTVDFPNDDDTAHQVYSLSPAKKFNLGFYSAGEKRSVVPDKPGVIDVRCYIHKNMKSTLVVVPGTLYSVAKIGGTFRIANVSPGKHVVKLWTPAGEQSKEISVPATGEAVADFAVR